MFNNIQLASLFSLMIVASSCRTTRMAADYDPETDFSKYNTFYFQSDDSNPIEPDTRENPFFEKHLRQHITDALRPKGYRPDPSNPDFFIAYSLRTRPRQIEIYSYHSCPSHHYPRRYHNKKHQHRKSDQELSFHGHYRPYVYDEITLTLDLIDSSKNELIWRGWTYEQSHGQTLSESRARKAIQNILSAFPPSR